MICTVVLLLLRLQMYTNIYKYSNYRQVNNVEKNRLISLVLFTHFAFRWPWCNLPQRLISLREPQVFFPCFQPWVLRDDPSKSVYYTKVSNIKKGCLMLWSVLVEFPQNYVTQWFAILIANRVTNGFLGLVCPLVTGCGHFRCIFIFS